MELKTEGILNKIFRDNTTLYGLKEFSDLDIKEIIKIFQKDGKYFLKCFKRDKDIQIYNPENNTGNPEEIIRQLWLYKIINFYNYPKDRIEVEKNVRFGREIHAKGIDIVIFHKDKVTPHVVIELKKPKEDEGIEQLKSYLSAEGAPIGVWSNGETKVVLYRPYPREYETVRDFPKNGQEIDDVIKEKLTLSKLKINYDLKEIINTLEELVLAGSGQDSFIEIFKLIYAKLYDEKKAKSRPDQEVLFRKSEDHQTTYETINNLFKDAVVEWPGIFQSYDKIELSPHHLAICITGFEEIKLFGSDLSIMDHAFEYLLTSVAKGERGQYFTPRNVVDMTVKMLNPTQKEFVIDPACGSAGFLVHAMWWVWTNDLKNSDQEEKIEYARRYIYGIDFDERAIKIARALMLIAGDGKSHIFKLNTLDTKEWLGEESEKIKARAALADLSDSPNSEENFKYFNFDVLLTNPPFAGEIRDQILLKNYELGKNEKGKTQNKVERHILFLERCLQMLKPDGRLAIVLPQGVLNNTNMAYIRRWLFDKARILAVVGLHGNTFKPHTGTKTSVLFLQKWQENEEPLKDYPIFMAVSQKSGKNNSGDYVYKKDDKGNPVFNVKNEKLLAHDLDEIADTFIKFAQEQKFSFSEK
ncbi:MAG: N-6 DNA methylase [bacterium]|nr:N-6 DNA methylase [bacterium]